MFNITYNSTTASVNISRVDGTFSTDISPNSLVTLQESWVNIMLSQVTYQNVTHKNVNTINGQTLAYHNVTSLLTLYNKLKELCFNPALANTLPEKRPIKTVTGNYLVTNDDNTISVVGTALATITLPPVATSVTQIFVIKRDDSMLYNVVVDGSGTDMIDDSVSKTLLNASDSITVQSNGTKWVII